LGPPAERELQQFVADRRAGQAADTVRRLLADNARYAEHWLSSERHAPNDMSATGYIDGQAADLGWLYSALPEQYAL